MTVASDVSRVLECVRPEPAPPLDATTRFAAHVAALLGICGVVLIRMGMNPKDVRDALGAALDYEQAHGPGPVH